MLCILTGGIILAWLGGLPELARDALGVWLLLQRAPNSPALALGLSAC